MQIISKINQDINNKYSFYNKKPPINGFTLIEMAIVLVIIALLIGGVMVGKSMMDNSKLRDIAIKSNVYMQAMEKFRDKYDALAGDMINATQIWGRADGDAAVASNCATPATDISTTIPYATCNGNGDGFVAANSAENYEIFRAWQQLKNDGLITGNLSGAAGAAGSSQAIVGTNIPASEFRKFGFDIKYISDAAIPADYFATVSYGHVLHFGEEVTGNNLAHAVALSSRSAAELDKKFDDNIPSTGKILSKNVATCVSSATAYNLAQDDGKQCTMIFKADF
jgi:prepilin-type N-terminal cleavage/methylation domain-containing protein